MARRDHGLDDLGRPSLTVCALLAGLLVAGCSGGDQGVRFVQRPGSRLVKVQTVGLAAFGPIVPYSATAADVVAAFGEPATTEPRGPACNRRWPRLGMTIEFSSAGGGDPCDAGGLIQQARVGGAAAERVGWSTAEGIRPGIPIAAARRIYPDARNRGDALVLVDSQRRADPPVLEVRSEGGRVSELIFPIRAGSS